MFKLQRLEITGFKSFADYTEIVFTGSGITAVVGPNGCGKSNVSDSIAWVLGEQKAKSLRGEEMKDVVFQGTSRRKASGMAEVVLHLVRDEESFFSDEESELEDIDASLGNLDENAVDLEEIESQQIELSTQDSTLSTNGNGFHSEEYEVEKVQAAQVGSVQTVEKRIKTKRHWKPRQFALDFAPGEAVSVTRRLYLSGESEYLLNGKTCRLRDIQDLFAGTGLSGSALRPDRTGTHRTDSVGKAFGQTKFNRRSGGHFQISHASARRRSTARIRKTNLSRITDIVSEIEKQANALRRQAAKTRRYKILREEFRQTLRQTFAAEGKHLSESVGELEEKLKEAEKAERAVFWAVAEKDDAFREATGKAREAEESLAQLRARHSENALERDRNSREKQYRSEQIANLTERSANLRGEIEATEQRLKLVKSEIKRLEKDSLAERAAAERAELDLREAEGVYGRKSKELSEIETKLETERESVLRHTAAFERLTEIARQLENTDERLQERFEGLRREGMRAAEIFAEHRRASEKLEKTLDERARKTGKSAPGKTTDSRRIERSAKRFDAAEKISNDWREEFFKKRNRVETLRELEERKTIYAPAVQKLFAEQKRIGVNFWEFWRTN
jgi:chromosome segregation protein